MKSYIFLTIEGCTFQPNGDDELVQVENLQVIGFAEGTNADDAYKNLLLESSYLRETSFEAIFCYQLSIDYERTRKDYNLHE